MIPRSLLFVPGDSEKKLAKGLGSGADLLILDLEDSVAQEKLPLARGMVREFLQAHPDRSKQELWVRVNPLATPNPATTPSSPRASRRTRNSQPSTAGKTLTAAASPTSVPARPRRSAAQASPAPLSNSSRIRLNCP